MSALGQKRASLPLFLIYRLLEVRLAPACRLVSIPTNSTVVFLSTILASFLASQFVRRTHPCDSVLLTWEGFGVPWIP